MAWKYIGEGRSITGAPAEDLPDDVFAACEKQLDAQFGVKGSLSVCQHPKDERGDGHACLVYEHVADKPDKKAAAEGA